jgi:uncharacterized protein (TIGR02118 family)
MERMLILFSPPADPEAFQRTYFDAHIDLVKKLPGLLHYTVTQAPRAVGAESPYFMVVELDWPDRDAMRAAWRSPEGEAVTAHATALDAQRLTLTFEVKDLLAG